MIICQIHASCCFWDKDTRNKIEAFGQKKLHLYLGFNFSNYKMSIIIVCTS